MDIDELVLHIIHRLSVYDYVIIELSPAKKSNSMYIKVNGKCLIRVADHYSHKDHTCKYNIGTHIKSFHTIKGSYYYRADRINSMIKKVSKYINDHKKDYLAQSKSIDSKTLSKKDKDIYK